MSQQRPGLGSSGPSGWPAPPSAARIRPTGGRALQEPVRRPKQLSFPEEPEVEYERSVIRLPVYLKPDIRGETPHEMDVMVFDAYMQLVREAPTTNGIGYRQFEFYIAAWELTNTHIAGLGADITFTLSDTVQPKSICIARQRESDYPALIVYSAIYDVYLGERKIVDKQPGVAFATPVWEIPPRNVTVAFEKPFQSAELAFSAGTCEGMRSISQAEFEQGVAVAQSVRGQV